MTPEEFETKSIKELRAEPNRIILFVTTMPDEDDVNCLIKGRSCDVANLLVGAIMQADSEGIPVVPMLIMAYLASHANTEEIEDVHNAGSC